MVKKFLAGLLCAVLLLGAVIPAAASGAEQPSDKRQLAIEDARRSYRRSLYSANKTSFSGYCGLLSSHQLWHMGINSWCAVYNGKDQYDAYCTEQITSGGYYIRPYSANQYTLEEALNAVSENGTKDVYNLLVGFQRTTSSAGRLYGHAFVINAILDGMVYMVECSYTKFAQEGQVIVRPISEIADYYKKMSFEGIIHFSREYVNVCSVSETDLFLQTRFESALRSQPCLVGQNQCAVLRSVAAGERLYATAVVTDPQGEVYYQIREGQQVAYIAAGAVSVLQVNPQALCAEKMHLASNTQVGQDVPLAGQVTGKYASVHQMEVTVTDETGAIVLREWTGEQGKTVPLIEIDGKLSFGYLDEGNYRVTVYADAACPAVGLEGMTVYYHRQKVWSGTIQVGSGPEGTVQEEARQPKDGWFFENGTWYCYENGKPCTGWVRWCGVSYYLAGDGSVTVGSTHLEGKDVVFSATGALCTGWLATEQGLTYRRSDGTAVAGWYEIQAGRYYFDETGILVTDAEVADGQTLYILGADGRAAVKPQEEAIQ